MSVVFTIVAEFLSIYLLKDTSSQIEWELNGVQYLFLLSIHISNWIQFI